MSEPLAAWATIAFKIAYGAIVLGCCYLMAYYAWAALKKRKQ